MVLMALGLKKKEEHMKALLQQILRLILVAFAASSILTGEPLAAEFDLAQPTETEQARKAPDMSAGKRPDDPLHFSGRGRIKMMAGVLASAQTVEPGDRLKIKFFADKPFRIIVDSREPDQFGNHKIIGHIEGAEYQTFIMTINEEDFSISLQDLTSNKTYFVSGKTGAGQGDVLEVDDRKRPRRLQ